MRLNRLGLLLFMLVHLAYELNSVDCLRSALEKMLISKGRSADGPVMEQKETGASSVGTLDRQHTVAYDQGKTKGQALPMDSSDFSDFSDFSEAEGYSSWSSEGETDSDEEGNGDRAKKRHRKLEKVKKMVRTQKEYIHKVVDGIKHDAIKPLSKSLEEAVDKVHQTLQLDTRGKLLALMNGAKKLSTKVRIEFGQFSFIWAQVMESALNYLGDTNLNQLSNRLVPWKERDVFDLASGALHSLAFGHELMLLLIIWREEMMITQQAFLEWFKDYKGLAEYENPVLFCGHVQAYMMLASWNTVLSLSKQIRAKIEFLMDKFDKQRAHSFESDFARDFTVLKESYVPLIEEFQLRFEHAQQLVAESALERRHFVEIDDWYYQYREQQAVLEEEQGALEWTVPEELNKFMNNLRPQLQAHPLVYTEGFLAKYDEINRRDKFYIKPKTDEGEDEGEGGNEGENGGQAQAQGQR